MASAPRSQGLDERAKRIAQLKQEMETALIEIEGYCSLESLEAIQRKSVAQSRYIAAKHALQLSQRGDETNHG